MKQKNNFQNSKNQTAQNFENAIINTQVNNYNTSINELLDFINEVIVLTQDKPILKIEIYFDGFKIEIEELFKSVTNYIHNYHEFRLSMNYLPIDNLDKARNSATNLLIKKIEKYIYELLYQYTNRKNKKINYHNFHKKIESLNKEYIEDRIDNEDYDKDDKAEEKALKIVTAYVEKKFFPIDEYNDSDFFNYLDSNEIEYIRIDFHPKTMKEFIVDRIDNGNVFCLCWSELYEELLDYDLRIMTKFLYTENNYNKTLFGLKQFIKDNKFKSFMYDEVDGMNPYSLYNICELKSWNRNNSTWNWNWVKDNKDIMKEYDYIESQIENSFKSQEE